MQGLSDVWPFHELELRTPRLLLRPEQDCDIAGLIAAALAGIHDPEVMPFANPWTRQEPDALALFMARSVWRLRAELSPEKWNVSFAIFHEGEVVGRQGVAATNFGELRTVSTGSWLTRRLQGIGLGKEMRAAILFWAFDYLGAEFAETEARSWNLASQGVSKSLGYRPNGEKRVLIAPGDVQLSSLHVLRREEFSRPDWQLRVRGSKPVEAFLGVSPH